MTPTEDISIHSTRHQLSMTAQPDWIAKALQDHFLCAAGKTAHESLINQL